MTKKSPLYLLLSALCMLLFTDAKAQRSEIFDENIATLTVIGDDWKGLPLTTIGGAINIDFDELSHEYHRYAYKIEHCDADWNVDEGLFESDYLNGFAEGNLIEDVEESVGTYQLYNHYHLRIPNKNCSIKMSGNYRLSVYDDNEDDTPVLYAYFMVAEQSAGIQIGVTTNTDIDVNNAHQQVFMQISYGHLQVNDPQRQLTTVVLQNQRWDMAVVNPPSQYTLRDGLRWEHCRQLIFPGGNEYHKFETLDPTNTTLGLANVGWDDVNSEWHAYVEPCYPQRSYTYVTDVNGAYLVRNSDNVANNTESDYVLTHFQLFCPQQQAEIYVGGMWTNYRALPEYQMEWNADDNCYEAIIPLKQGHYNYCILQKEGDSLVSHYSVGCFFETENQYDALLYYRGPTDRTDRLVAHSAISTKR